MRFYIIYDDQSKGIIASNTINKLAHNAILGDQEISNLSNILREINANLGRYDKIIILNNNPKSIEIQANKIQNVQASACKDTDDINDIAQLNINVVIINSNIDNESLEDLFNAMISNSKSSKKIIFSQQKQVYDNIDAQQAKNLTNNTIIKNKININKADASNQDRNKSNVIEDIKSKGVSKFLKDAFGIED